MLSANMPPHFRCATWEPYYGSRPRVEKKTTTDGYAGNGMVINVGS